VPTNYTGGVRLTCEIELETDGRWLAEVLELPGVMAYGESADQALSAAKALAFRVIADRIENGEDPGAVDTVEFVRAA
jgi:predicted RNase H-like HicB family nuclease